MRQNLTNLFSQVGRIWLEKEISRLLRVNILIILVQFLIIIFFITELPPQIPLFYSRPWGEAQLSSPLMLVILPVFSIAFLVTNTLLATTFLEKEIFLSKLLIFGSTLVSVFNLVTIVKIILLFV